MRKDSDDSKHPLDEKLPTRGLGLFYDVRAIVNQKDEKILQLENRLRNEVARLAECKSDADRKLEAQVVRMQAMAREHEADRARREKELKDVQEKIGEAEDCQDHLTAQLVAASAKLVVIKQKLDKTKTRLGEKKIENTKLKGALADMERKRDHCKHNEEVAAANAKLAGQHYENEIAELRQKLETERKLGVAEGKGEVAAAAAVVKQYESEMRRLHEELERRGKTIEQMTPAYNAANSFAAAVRGVPVQKSLEDGPVIREVEA